MDYGHTYICKNVPNNAVCTPEPEFVYLMERDAKLKVYETSPPIIESTGFSGWTLVGGIAAGIAVGAITALALKH